MINNNQDIDEPVWAKHTDDKIVQQVKRQRTNENCIPENVENNEEKENMPPVSRK